MSTASRATLHDTKTASAGVATEIASSYPGLLRLLRSRIKDRELANDLIHQAIAITLEHLRAGRVNVTQLAGYVFTTAQNLLRNHQRLSHNRSELRSDAAVLECLAAGEPPASEDQPRMRHIVRELLRSLSPRDFDVITRFYLEECDKDEICRDLGLTTLQFNQVVSRARQRLRTELERRGFKGTDFICLMLTLV